VSEHPLTPDRRLRVAAGEEVRSIAKDIGVAPRTVSRWKDREDFAELVRKQRAALVGELESPEEVARSALVATKKDGTPDWNARLTACRILLAAPAASKEAKSAARETRIYVIPDQPDVGAPRPTPIDPDEITRRGEEAHQQRTATEVKA